MVCISPRGICVSLLVWVCLAAPLYAAERDSDGGASSLVALREYLAEAREQRTPLAQQAFAGQPLSRAVARQASDLLWKDHVAFIRQSRQQEMQDKRIALGKHALRFDYKIFGKKPAKGRSLYISMHGGGGTTQAVNDQQWENQKRLYRPQEGVYLAPRAPTNTWNLWHQGHIDPLFDRLITNLIVFEQVDPNRVYLMGYSAGGDGVYQLAPRMADRWAAAAMMAGHPNEASPLSLRNIGFTLHMGALDKAYNRNGVARQWQARLAKLKEDDPHGYPHHVRLHEGKGHWMDRQDAVAVPWMARFRRDPVPQRVVWHQDDVTHSASYWLAVPEAAKARALVRADRDGQRVTLTSSDVKRLTVRLDDRMVNLDDKVVIEGNGEMVFAGRLTRSIANLAASLAVREDPALMFSAAVTVELR
ncbi:MAG: alpha/beta hydrolase [Planctomycetaceae bacterium]|nr:alpha/beta hydrolase [Planctomycetaceae bacterium]